MRKMKWESCDRKALALINSFDRKCMNSVISSNRGCFCDFNQLLQPV